MCPVRAVPKAAPSRAFGTATTIMYGAHEDGQDGGPDVGSGLRQHSGMEARRVREWGGLGARARLVRGNNTECSGAMPGYFC